MVNIREFYEKDDKMLPGKKVQPRLEGDSLIALRHPSLICTPLTPPQGISLSVDQFKGVIEALPEIEAALRAKDITIPRPTYSSDQTVKDEAKEEEEEEAVADDDEEVPAESSKGELDRFKMGKGNHEATSDEDE